MNQSDRDTNFISEKSASERLQTLYAVNDLLKQVDVEGLDINLILNRLINVAVEKLESEEGSIIVVDAQRKVEYISWADKPAASPRKPPQFLDTVIEDGLAGWVLQHQQPYIVNDTRNNKRWLPRPGHITSTAPWSIICTPFISREQAIGVITIHKPGINQFDERDLDLLMAISNQAASSIENARLLANSRRQLQISAVLNQASQVINSSLDINEIMRSLLAQMNVLLNAEAISIALVDPSTNQLVYQVAEGIGSDAIVGLRVPSNQGLSGWVMKHGEPALVTDTAKDSRFHTQGDQRTGHPTRAMICAPMVFKGDVLGTIQAINPIDGTFTQQDLDLLVNLANIASSAIANAQQYARTQVAEKQYISLFQDSVDAIILTDIGGTIVEANQRAIELLGYPRNELVGKSIAQYHAADTVIPKADEIRSQRVCVFKSQVIPADKPPVHVEVYAKQTQFGDNEVLQWIHHNISKQVELEQMREDLTAMLFHDLQSPLGNVISSLELLSFEVPADNPILDSMLDIAIRSSHRLQDLIRSLLDINQLEANHPIGERTSVDIYKLIDDVEEFQKPGFEQRKIEFIRNIADNLPDIYAEEDMIRRVLVNLLDNALKYSEESQRITIAARLISEESSVVFSVSDQGVGIPEQYRKTIFQKFERIDKSSESKGLGLGLAFCRLAVEAHGGRIWVDDADSGGARFNFTVPIVSNKLPAAII